MGQNQPRENGDGSPLSVQKSRQQGQGDAMWDDIKAIDRTGANFQAARGDGCES